jgi:hypothetical protein
MLCLGTDDLNLEDSVFGAKIIDGSQVDVIPKINFTVICRDPQVQMKFDVKRSTKLKEIKANILTQLAADAVQVFLSF